MLYTKEEIQRKIERKRRIKNMVTIMLYIILIPILVYNVFLIVQTILNPNKTPSFLGIKTYVIISGSMEPELNIGDIVIVKESNEIQKGDIISYREGQRVITHRVYNVTNLDGEINYITKGDNNNIEDSTPTKLEMVEGKVISKIPFIGYISIWLQNKIVVIGLIIIYCAYILHTMSIKRKKNIRDIKRREYEKLKKQEE